MVEIFIIGIFIFIHSINKPCVWRQNENLSCREVFPLGGTAWEDDKKITHINLTKEI
jgi:hypothetical protein